MASTYPSVVATLIDPNPTDRLNSPSHSGLHQSENAEIEQIQTFVGTTSSLAGTLMHDIRSPESDGGGHVQSAAKGGTGQTSYNKGDILVASSSSVLTKLAVGATNQVLVADPAQATGVRWGTGAIPTVRTYSRPSVTGVPSFVGLWTKPSNLSYITIRMVDGGGAGGNETDSDNTPYAAQGGNSGNYGESIILASALPTVASIVLGSGATSATSQSITRFGSVLTASMASLYLPGQSGTQGGGRGGDGGSNPLGTGGQGISASDTNGNPGLGYGSGGGGCGSSPTPTGLGGPGANGAIIIIEN